MEIVVYIIIGVVIGVVVGWFIKSHVTQNILDEKSSQIREKDDEIRNLRDELDREKQSRIEWQTRFDEFQQQRGFIEEELKGKFATISLEALSQNSAEFLKLAEKVLESKTVESTRELGAKKELIDQSIQAIDKRLYEMKQKIDEVGKGSIEISTLIKKHEEVTAKLKDTTDHLSQALASSKKRGEWGERMAEDIIRLVGMVEGINYIKQKTLESVQNRPDYTFLLPNNLKLNMDVKFPMENYKNYLDAQSEHEKKRYRDELLRNVKNMIKQVTTRDYINPLENTVDYVIVFIPNEQVYSFVNEEDRTIMDEALKQKVILCSPFTLYAVLAVIRQAIENFNLEKTASEILRLLAEFSKQWSIYKERFKAMGDKLDAAKKEYDSLITTRSNMLEKPLRKVEELRQQHAIALEEKIELDE